MPEEPAPSDSPPPLPRRHDGIGDQALRSFLALHPGIRLATWTWSDRAVVDLLSIPEWHRRRGMGTMVYRLWEATLGEGMLVELFSVDADAAAFWRTLGFEGSDNGIMRKTVAAPCAAERRAGGGCPSTPVLLEAGT